MYGFLTYQRWKFRCIIFSNVKLLLLSHFNYKLIFDSQKVKNLQRFLPERLDWNKQLEKENQPLKSLQGIHANTRSL